MTGFCAEKHPLQSVASVSLVPLSHTISFCNLQSPPANVRRLVLYGGQD